MEKVKFYKLLIISLLVLNFGMLGFFWFFAPPPHDPARPARFIIRELRFNSEQIQKFAKLREDHQKKSRALREKMQNTRKGLSALLAQDELNSRKMMILADSIGYFQKNLEIVTFEHFVEVRKLGNKAQKKQFDKIILEVLQMMSPPLPPKR